MRPAFLAFAVALLATACATVPTGPSMLVLPGAGKSFEQFQEDDAVCRQWAAQRTGIAPSTVAMQGTLAGATAGTAVGAAAGAAVGAAAGSPGAGMAVGAGVGLLGGTMAGADYGESRATSAQGRYDMAYMQCMYAKGNQIPLPRGSQPAYAPVPVAAPTNVPPPPPGTPPPPPPGPVR